MNMESHHLPRTARVNDKIMEYYMKFGRDRDLEKFMRVYSPANTDSTATTTSNSSREDDVFGIKRLFQQARALCNAESKSLPEMDFECCLDEAEHRVVNIPIRLEGRDELPLMSASVDDLVTPTKDKRALCKETQTPESIGKTHKRLEWDSLGDVGYMKSKSTSNISMLERSLLRELFNESFCETPDTAKSKQKPNNASEGNLKSLRVDDYPSAQASTSNTARKYNTPPLASSTFVDSQTKSGKSTGGGSGARPKIITQHNQATSTSMARQHEKSAQTSMQRPVQPPFNSQEVQVNMSSASTSNMGSSATPSSFEYYSSRSSRTTTATSTEEFKLGRRSGDKKHQQQQQQQQQHPFVVGLTEMLARRKALAQRNSAPTAYKTHGPTKEKPGGEKRREWHSREHRNAEEVEQLAELHETLRRALNETDDDNNKENSGQSSAPSSSSTSLLLHRSPQLSLGIQLLCSLIDAKSLNRQRKKQLVREIVKRISGLGIGSLTASEMDESSSRQMSLRPDSERNSLAESAGGRVLNKPSLEKTNSPPAGAKKGLQEQLKAEQVKVRTKSKEGTRVRSSEKVVEINVESAPSLPATSSRAPTKSATVKAPSSRQEAVKHQKATEIDWQREEHKARTTTRTTSTTALIPSRLDKSTAAPSKVSSSSSCTASSDPPALDTATTTPSTSTSKELITQKAAPAPQAPNCSNTDSDQATMREWLNPLTQSEIDYEEKKRAEAAKLKSKASERDVQLNWIDCEIQRLESLRHLLVQKKTTKGTAPATNTARLDTAMKGTKKTTKSNGEKIIYDTVCSEQSTASSSASSSALSANAERIVQEIEVIIEESHEDIINLDDKSKRSKDRKRETRIVYDKPCGTPADDLGGLGSQQGRARFRSMRETIVTNEDQVLESTPSEECPNEEVVQAATALQRCKIDTPPPVSSTNDTESVGSFVQQRKRDFLEQYRQKKRTHREALLRQEQMRRNCLRQLPQDSNAQHYNMPHRHHHVRPCQHQAGRGMTAPPHAPPPPLPPHCAAVRSNVLYTAAAAAQTQHQHSYSTSSVFCVSSDMSIPMGSQATRSTATTTHQYDDVAHAFNVCCPTMGGGGGRGLGADEVAVQTTDSLLHTQPIFGPERRQDQPGWPCGRAPRVERVVRSDQTATACVQVKPKAIAYVIHFHEKNQEEGPKRPECRPAVCAAMVEEEQERGSAEDSPQTEAEQNSADQEDEEAPLATCDERYTLTLQQHLARARPAVLEQIKERKAILNCLQSLRQAREREMREIVENTSMNSLERHLRRLPPPPTKHVRIFPTRQMKAITKRHVAQLPEVVQRKQHEREEQLRRGNRLLRDVFNRRLQKRVRSGKLSLNHSGTVI